MSASVPEKMRAWVYSKFGGGASALTLDEQFPVPKPPKGSVLVKVKASSVNPVDWKLQDGIARPFLPGRIPFVPGIDVAGDVVAVGPGVTKFKPGDAVFGGSSVSTGGGFAEYAVLSEGAAAIRPSSVSEEDAASLPVAGLSALQPLRDYCGVPLPGSKEWTGEGSYKGHVLVANASGGVGHFAVQLAKLAGAHVTATAGTRNEGFVKNTLHADDFLDYKSPEGQQLSPPSGKPYDVVLDGTSNLTWKIVQPQLASQGTWVHLTPPVSFMGVALWQRITFQSQRALPFIAVQKSADLATLANLVAEGKLTVVKDAVVPFDKAPEAWEKSISGHVVGKVVVKH